MMRIAIAILLMALAGAKEEPLLCGHELNHVNQALLWLAIAAEGAEQVQTSAVATSPPSKPPMTTKSPHTSYPSVNSNKWSNISYSSTKAPKNTKAPKGHKLPKNPPHCPKEIDYAQTCDSNMNADTCGLHTLCQHACLPMFCKLPCHDPHKIHGYNDIPDDHYVELGSICGSMVYVKGHDFRARNDGFSPRHEVEVCCLIDDMTQMVNPYQDGECVGCYYCDAPQKVNDVCCKIALSCNDEKMGQNGDFGPKCQGKTAVCCKCAPGNGPEAYTCIGEYETCDFTNCEMSTISTSTSTVTMTLLVTTLTLPATTMTTLPVTTTVSTAVTTTTVTTMTMTAMKDYVTCPSGRHCYVELGAEPFFSDDSFLGDLDACVEICHMNLASTTYWAEVTIGECNCYDSCDLFNFDPLYSMALVDNTNGGTAACPTKSICGRSIVCSEVTPFTSSTDVDADDLDPCLSFCNAQIELLAASFESYWILVVRNSLCECYSPRETSESTSVVNSLLVLVDETASGSAVCPPEPEMLTASGEAQGCPSPHVNYLIVGDSIVFGACIDAANPVQFQQNNVNLLGALANFETESCWGLDDRVLIDIHYSAFRDGDAYATQIQSALVDSVTDINPNTIGPFQLTFPDTLNPYKTVILDNPVNIPLEEQVQLMGFMVLGGRVIIIVDGQLSDESIEVINDVIQNQWGGTSVFDTTIT